MTKRTIQRITIACLAAISLTAATRSIANDSEGALSHAALFAPNKSFPYFAAAGELDAARPAAFSSANAAMLAQCSLLIYVKEEPFIEAALARAGFPEVEFFDQNGTYAFLAESEKHIVITFRGTETGDKADYLTDSKFHQKEFTEHGAAHAGFIEAIEQVQSDLQLSLSERLKTNPNKTVWVTGHSLGGALATLFSIQNLDFVDALYPIGSPRVVGQKLAKRWQDLLPIFRIVNNNDLVPRVPAQPFYQHLGPTYFLTAEHELIIDPPFSKAWKERLKGHTKFIKRLINEHWLENDFSAIPSDYFVDHSPRLYAEILIERARQEAQ